MTLWCKTGMKHIVGFDEPEEAAPPEVETRGAEPQPNGDRLPGAVDQRKSGIHESGHRHLRLMTTTMFVSATR